MGFGDKIINALKPVHERRAEAKAIEDAKNPPKEKSAEDDKNDPNKKPVMYNPDVHAAAASGAAGFWAVR